MIVTVRNDGPLIVSIPHAGLEIPEDIAPALISPARARHDADLYVDQLYAFAFKLGATLIRTTTSRTVIDVNRDPSGQTLYPGQFTTGLCPRVTFDGDPLYHPGQEPDETEIARRRAAWFDPYHAALTAEIDRLRDLHPAIVLYEAHSIRSVVPKLFDGRLPEFNIGTNSGQSCAPELAHSIAAICAEQQRSHVIDGRFKGGWTTRNYGEPDKGVHAIQMELAMRTYLTEVPAADWPPRYDDLHAAQAQATLRPILSAAIDFARTQ
ncbi:N-formylglutamate deformylase [Sphingomonas suaedae]|uniref:N-formylglutamate deformylase n=1 Tax=Sphingomonas suaedae TaxID=2599297 RepID=A0A518RDR3_9SPHN|nr:N-formylglutamate deformylase [Sphingomonas suaedae]QDX25582.1 N-formylglutamate deformylase [Sphingomonas suaedae]